MRGIPRKSGGGVAFALALAAVASSPPAPAHAAPIVYSFTASAVGGPLNGQSFSGSLTADSTVVAAGHGTVGVSFSLLGTTFTETADAFGNTPAAAFDLAGNVTFFGSYDVVSAARAAYLNVPGGVAIPSPVTSFAFGGTFSYGTDATQGETNTGGPVSFRLAAVAVPEPASVTLFGAACLGLAALVRAAGRRPWRATQKRAMWTLEGRR